jgi:hypothetical protein
VEGRTKRLKKDRKKERTIFNPPPSPRQARLK